MKRIVILVVIILAIALVLFFVFKGKGPEAPKTPTIEEAIPEVPEDQPGEEIPEGFPEEDVEDVDGDARTTPINEEESLKKYHEALLEMNSLITEQIAELKKTNANDELLAKLEEQYPELEKEIKRVEADLAKIR